MVGHRSSFDVDGYLAERARLLADPDLTGPDRRVGLAGITDRWLGSLFEQSGATGLDAALVAVGGYGRRELAPGSDLDLLLLHGPREAVDGVAEQLWYPIWDAGLKLDHSTRTVAEARELARSDLRVVLGLLDARLVAGGASMLAELRQTVLSDWRAAAPKRLAELGASVRERTESHGEVAHLLEPDLKESYGGLRDVVILRSIDASWMADSRVWSLAQAAVALRDVRDALHMETGRGSDRLLLEVQEAVASRTGHGGSDDLLRHVCAAGRTIAFVADNAWTDVGRAIAGHRPRRRLVRGRDRDGGQARLPLAAGVVLQNDEAVLALDARPEADPALVLRAAAAAAQAGVRLSHHAVERLVNESAPMPIPWPSSARDELVSLLGAGRATIPVWEALDQAGVIERLLPPWKHVRSAPQHNPVHRFTVDRHLVETAVVAASLTRRVARPDLLLVAALLHDIGKGRPGDHTEIGIRVVERLVPRIGFDEGESAVIRTLVANHLLLPHTATRRDLSDPATAALVADAVGDAEVLDLLHALAEADALAAGPAAWSSWKATLVAELVERTQAHISGSAAPARPLFTDDQLTRARTGGLHVSVEPRDDVCDVTVVADDQLGLLAAVAGVLALNRMRVRSARTQTVEDRAVTTWVVAPGFSDPPDVTRLREDIRRCLAGGLDVARLLRERAENGIWRRSGALPGPTVTLVPEASSKATVMEVRAHDGPGLLFTIASTISRLGLRIDAAHAETMGSEAVDAFYVSDARGGLLRGEVAADARLAVLAALEHDVFR